MSTAPQAVGTQRIGNEQFVFVVCQHGTEPTMKACWLAEGSPFRLAFSRPGLLTFKLAESHTHPQSDGVASGGENAVHPPLGWLVRLSGFVLGQVKGTDANELARQAVELAGREWDAVHVFSRDPGLPGMRGFEPGATELTRAVGEVFAGLLPGADVSGEPCALGSRVLDVILIEPDFWLIGHHRAAEIHQQWPGGAFPLTRPPEMISRAYLKMAEAVAWSRLPIRAGDKIVEVGSSPGGASQRLLDLGLKVTGIDPAEMDPLLLKHERFVHWRKKSAAVRRKMYGQFKWLAADANVTPNYTLDAVEDIVTYPTSRFQGLLLTLKLSSYDLVDEMEAYLNRIRGWGFERIEARQLATNRRECCVVAQRGSDWKPAPYTYQSNRPKEKQPGVSPKSKVSPKPSRPDSGSGEH